MWRYEYDDDGYNVPDSVPAVVTGSSNKDPFLRLENGQEAFTAFDRLDPGKEVLCTMLKKATERWRIIVAIDSVLERELAA